MEEEEDVSVAQGKPHLLSKDPPPPKNLRIAGKEKTVFEEIQEWALFKGCNYNYSDGLASQQGLFKKMLYFDEDLVGMGEGPTPRQAKIQCATNGVENL